MKKIKVAVMGCTGLVGQQFVRMLDNHPLFELVALTSSSRSAGKKYADSMNWAVGGDIPRPARDMKVLDTCPESLLDYEPKIVFSAIPPFLAEDIERFLRQQGIFIFSNASSRRMDEDVPILIPEVNSEHLEIVRQQTSCYKGFIITNSNCSTTGLVMALKPLEKFGIQEIIVTTYQSISGAGRQGLPAMDIVGNIIPFIRNEEEKMERESKKILGHFNGRKIIPCPLRINASCSRVSVREGHLLSLVIKFKESAEVEVIRETLASFKGIPQAMKLPTAPESPLIVRSEEDRPQPILDVYAGQPERARGMTVTVGRIRKKARAINLYLLVHNTIRGAAGTCLLSAELAVMKNYIS